MTGGGNPFIDLAAQVSWHNDVCPSVSPTVDYANNKGYSDTILLWHTIDIVHSDYTFCARTHTPSAQLEEGEGLAGWKTCKRSAHPASQAEF